MRKENKSDGMSVYDSHVAFWGGALSNFYGCKIHVDTDWDGKPVDLNFHCSEQYFMWLKATWFHDYDIAEKILEAKTPKEAKALGRQVEGFDEEEWKKYNATSDIRRICDDLNEFYNTAEHAVQNAELDQTMMHAEAMQENIEGMLSFYLGIDKEKIKEFLQYSDAKKASLIEEVLLNA